MDAGIPDSDEPSVRDDAEVRSRCRGGIQSVIPLFTGLRTLVPTNRTHAICKFGGTSCALQGTPGRHESTSCRRTESLFSASATEFCFSCVWERDLASTP